MTTFSNATIEAKANIYFDGKVISHTVTLEDGERKTIGLIFPGSFHFGTAEPELMEIISGECQVVIDDTEETKNIKAGSSFNVAGNSGFTMTVNDSTCEYICSYLPE